MRALTMPHAPCAMHARSRERPATCARARIAPCRMQLPKDGCTLGQRGQIQIFVDTRIATKPWLPAQAAFTSVWFGNQWWFCCRVFGEVP